MATALDISQLSEDRTLGRLFKLAPTSVGLARESAVAVDESAMSATAIISTPTPDRVNDLVVPSGCRLENYKKNPVVLWEHGFGLSLPIAKSEDPDGNLTVAIGEGNVTATSYFTHRLKESEQIFELITEGIVRATSIRLTPLKSNFKRNGDDDVFLIEVWDLEEWSWVAIPCNPEAVAGVVSKNKLAGSPIADPILKSLKHWMPESKPQVQGADLGGKKKMAKKKPIAKNDPPVDDEDVEKTDDETPEEDEPKADEPEGDPPAEETPQDEAEQKYGAQVLSAAHASLAALVGEVKAALGPLENEAVKAALDEFVAGQDEALSLLNGAYSSAYGKSLDMPAEGEEDEAEVVKSFLANAAGPRYQVQGLGARLKALSQAKNIDKQQRAVLDGVARQLVSLVAKAKAAPAQKTSQPTATETQLRKELDELKATFGEVTKSINDARPHRVAQ